MTTFTEENYYRYLNLFMLKTGNYVKIIFKKTIIYFEIMSIKILLLFMRLIIMNKEQ